MKNSLLFKLLSILFMLMLLTSCAPPTASNPAQNESNIGQDTGEAYQVVWLQGCPWVSIPLPDPKEDAVHQYILENYGIDLKVQFNAECDDAKTAAQIAAGDVPDFMQQYWDASNPVLTQLIDQGIILPIELDQYPGMKNALSAEAYTYLSRDGEVWGIAPPADPTHQTLWIRQDWLDNLGLQAPTTPEEALEVARAFTFDDPDGNGQNDTYGLTSFATAGGNPYGGLTALLAPFGFIPGRADLMVEGSRVYFPGLSEDAKQGLMWLNQAVTGKVIDPAWSTNTEDQFREAVATNKVGMVTYYFYMLNPNFYDVVDRIAASGSPASWVWVDPLTGRAGQYMQVQPYANGIGNAFFVTSQAQSEPGKYEAVMKFLDDAINTESDLYRMMVWGIQDQTYSVDEQGNIAQWQVDDATRYLRNYRLFRTGNTEYRVGSWQATQPIMVEGFARADTLPVLWSVRGLVPAHAGQADFDQYIAEMHIKFVTGEESFDNWDAFVDRAMSTFGGQEILDDTIDKLKALGLVEQ